MYLHSLGANICSRSFLDRPERQLTSLSFQRTHISRHVCFQVQPESIHLIFAYFRTSFISLTKRVFLTFRYLVLTIEGIDKLWTFFGNNMIATDFTMHSQIPIFFKRFFLAGCNIYANK